MNKITCELIFEVYPKPEGEGEIALFLEETNEFVLGFFDKNDDWTTTILSKDQLIYLMRAGQITIDGHIVQYPQESINNLKAAIVAMLYMYSQNKQ